MKIYKNIIFDLGGVLLDIDYNLTRQAFVNLGVADFDEMYSQANADELFQNLERGTISIDDFYQRLNDCTGRNLSVGEINKAWNALLLDFRETSLDYLETLKPKATLVLLSNTNQIHLDAFDKIYHSRDRAHNFSEYFHHCIYSFQTGTRKPDAACFEWVLQHTRLDAHDTIFIDDSVQNVEAARQLGLKSILLEKGMMIEDLGLEKMLANQLPA